MTYTMNIIIDDAVLVVGRNNAGTIANKVYQTTSEKFGGTHNRYAG